MIVRMTGNMTMKPLIMWLAVMVSVSAVAIGGVKVDDEVFGNSLGGWKKRDNKAAEYPLSGSVYRTYKPEVTPTPEGGLFVSLRIDHVRGWLSSDDHAVLEITVDAKGAIVSAQSTIAIQGRSISSDLIVGVNESGKKLVGTEQAVQIGTDLIANLSAKLLREKVVEAGRVSFPSVLRHNYNLLFQAIRQETAGEKTDTPAAPENPASPAPVQAPAPTPSPAQPPAVNEPAKDPVKSLSVGKGGIPLGIKPYGTR
jgi:hypothetical protein